MAISSIFKEFYVDADQAEKFANAIEESYQESLTRKREFPRAHFATDEEAAQLLKSWKKKHEAKL